MPETGDSLLVTLNEVNIVRNTAGLCFRNKLVILLFIPKIKPYFSENIMLKPLKLCYNFS